MALMAFAGCKKKGADMGALAKDVCACKDMQCAQDVQKKFAEKQGDKGGKRRPTRRSRPEDDKKAIKDMTDCMTKLATAGAGGDMKGDKKDDDKKMDGDKKDDKGGGDKMAGGDSTGVPDCDAVMTAYAKYFECDKVKAAGGCRGEGGARRASTR